MYWKALIQRNFSWRVPSLLSKSHTERLAILNTCKLELRRLRFDFKFSIINFSRVFIFSTQTLFSPHTFHLSLQPVLRSDNISTLDHPFQCVYNCIQKFSSLELPTYQPLFLPSNVILNLLIYFSFQMVLQTQCNF